jgi:hypothetical protein
LSPRHQVGPFARGGLLRGCLGLRGQTLCLGLSSKAHQASSQERHLRHQVEGVRELDPRLRHHQAYRLQHFVGRAEPEGFSDGTWYLSRRRVMIKSLLRFRPGRRQDFDPSQLPMIPPPLGSLNSCLALVGRRPIIATQAALRWHPVRKIVTGLRPLVPKSRHRPFTRIACPLQLAISSTFTA